MDGWSFLAGGVVFGFFFFILGGIIGMVSHKDNSFVSSISKDILNKLKPGQSINFQGSVYLSPKDDDGDDEFFDDNNPSFDLSKEWRN